MQTRIGLAARLFSALVLVVMALSVGAAEAHALGHTRIGSADTVASALQVSRATFPSGARSVVLAGAWHDSLCGAGLAGAADGPLLQSPLSSVPPAVIAEAQRLGAARAYLIGAFSDSALAQIRAALPAEAEVVRIVGANAAETSELVAELVRDLRGSRPQYVLAASVTRPDLALALAGPAASEGWPVVLYDSSDAWRPARVAYSVEASSALLVGDLSAVGSSAQRALAKVLRAEHVRTIEAADAYRASWDIAQWTMVRTGATFARPVFVTASPAANRVSAGAYAAARGSVAIMALTSSLPAWQADRLFAYRSEASSIAFFGNLSSLRRTEIDHALRARLFSAPAAMRHVRALTALGPRKGGSYAERRGAEYIAGQLRSWGYSTRMQTVYLPGGKQSRNVIAEKRGATSDVIVLGAHLDSKPPSPGGNDNASGVAVTLELARILAQGKPVPTVRFIAFGAEEIGGPTPDDHHFGSRQYVSRLSWSERSQIEGMVSIDMVGYGSVFNVRNLRRAPMSTVYSLQSWGRYSGQPVAYLKDPSRTGWSDHEAFEFKGIPVAWLEWRDDWAYHTARDTYGHVQPDRVGRTGRLVRGWVLDLTAAEVEGLKP